MKIGNLSGKAYTDGLDGAAVMLKRSFVMLLNGRHWTLGPMPSVPNALQLSNKL